MDLADQPGPSDQLLPSLQFRQQDLGDPVVQQFLELPVDRPHQLARQAPLVQEALADLGYPEVQ